ALPSPCVPPPPYYAQHMYMKHPYVNGAASAWPAAETLLEPSPCAYTRTTRASTGHQPRAAGRKRVEPDGARTVRGATSGRRLRQLGWYHGSRRPETSGRRFCL